MFTRREDSMKKAKRIGLSRFMPVFALGMAFVCFLAITGEAQKAKPPKPPQTPCDLNGNCEYAEMDWDKSRADQPCLDCQPKTYGTLFLREGILQIAGEGLASPSNVFLCEYTGDGATGEFKVVWESDEVNVTGLNVRIGDIDNDGQKEVVALHTTTTVVGKGNKKQTLYSHEVLIFENGDSEVPTSRMSLEGLECYHGPVHEIRIADVDNDADGHNELILMKSGSSGGVFEVYGVTQIDENSHEIGRLFSSEVYSGGLLWNLEVGDADNDAENEILISRSKTTRPLILEFNGDGWDQVGDNMIEPTGPDEAFWEDGTLNINVMKVRDVDGDGDNEIIAGGNSGWLMIWKFDEGYYDKVFSVGVAPGSFRNSGLFTWAMDAGDIDGDDYNEIVVGLFGGALTCEAIRIYKYAGGTNYLEVTLTLPAVLTDRIGVDDVRVGDLDGDGIAEIVTGQDGLTIYRYDPSGLVKLYNFALGGPFEIH
jgi:hypothetical protein